MARRRYYKRDSKGRFAETAGGGGKSSRAKSSEVSKRSSATTARSSRARSAVSKRAQQIRANGVANNFSKVKAAYEVYNDVGDVASNGSKAALYGATGNYVRAGLHGAKAATATSRLATRGARTLADRGTLQVKDRKKFDARLNKIDDRVQTVDNIATIGLFVTGVRSAPLKKPPRRRGPDMFTETMGRSGAGVRDTQIRQPRPAGKPKRTASGPVYVITDVRKTAGGRVRDTR